jgi:hypothetical protein
MRDWDQYTAAGQNADCVGQRAISFCERRTVIFTHCSHDFQSVVSEQIAAQIESVRITFQTHRSIGYLRIGLNQLVYDAGDFLGILEKGAIGDQSRNARHADDEEGLVGHSLSFSPAMPMGQTSLTNLAPNSAASEFRWLKVSQGITELLPAPFS